MATVIESLREKISDANHKYWKLGKPDISDVEYDKLVRALRKLSPHDPLLEKIGTETNTGEKVRHREHMYSLDKAYTFDEVIKWATKCARSEDELFYAAPKYDGLSLEAQGDRIITRGDGEYGMDITHLAGHIVQITKFEYDDEKERYESDGFPLDPMLEHAESSDRVVGELLVPIDRFFELKKQHPEFMEYKTPRNMTSGFAMLKKPVPSMTTPQGIPLHIADFVSHTAFKIPLTFKELKKTDPKKLEAKLRDFSGYPTDGIVFFVDDLAYRTSLGFTQHHPIGGIALKFVDEQKETTLQKIEWQVGQEHVTPVAVFDPVIIDGVCVNKATFHNASFLKESGAVPGCTITIERRGGVIPKVVNVDVPKGSVAEIITECPVCGKKLEWHGRYLNCDNEECEAKIVTKLVKGLAYLGIKGVGPALAEKLVADYYIKDIITFATEFGMTDPETRQLKINELKGKGYSASQIVSALRIGEVMQKGVKASDLLKSICIAQCQDQFINAINQHNGGVMKIIYTCPVDRIYDILVDRPGVALDALTHFMIWAENNIEIFQEYVKMFKIIPEETVEHVDAQYKGFVCFTGAGPKPRKEMDILARNKGYYPTEKMSQATLLVCEDRNSSSSKMSAARRKNIPILTYDEFLK